MCDFYDYYDDDEFDGDNSEAGDGNHDNSSEDVGS